MSHKTPLYDAHLACGGKIVDFAGWQMPIHYGSQIDEHQAVRTAAGMFDVSHMTVVDIRGAGSREFLRRLLANDVARLKTPGKALYSCMLRPDGGIIDDLITYYMNDNWYRTVVNAATRDKDLAWLREQATGFDTDITERSDLAMIAVQGPKARAAVHGLLGDAGAAEALAPFQALELGDWFIARTGYTGEDGYEVMLPADQAADFWQQLRDAGVSPCGLGARDTLRLEAGMNLYGTDMDENFTPLDSGLAWTVAMEPTDRDFIGRAALEQARAGDPRWRFVGLVLEDKGVLRGHQKIFAGDREVGEITSGSFSPSLKLSIAMARISDFDSTQLEVEIRNKRLKARVVKPVFVRNGKSCLQ